MITFDHLIEKRIKMGRFQLITLLIISLIDFADGIEKTLVGTLLSILQHEWNLNQFQVSTLASAFYVGIVGGTLLCAFYADQIGRAKSLEYASLCAFLLLVWHSIAQVYLEVLFLRFCFGLIFGTTIPLGHVVISEIVPARIRGQVTSIVSFIFIIGKVYCTLLQMIFLDNYESGRWRLFLIVNSIPLLICFISSRIYLRESPRYFFMNNKQEEAFYEIERIGRINNQQEFRLTEDEKQQLTEQQNWINRIGNSSASIKYLFSNQFSSFTYRMWIVFILTSIIETTLYFLTPYWLKAYNSKGFLFQLYMMLAELCAAISVFFIIDSKKTGGRTKLVVIISLIILIICSLTYIFEENLLIFGLSGISFFLKIMFTAEMVIMNENYTTKYRSMGVGMTQSVGKMIGVISPYIIFPLFNNNKYSPFMLYSISMLILAILAATFPFDMTQIELDSIVPLQQELSILSENGKSKTYDIYKNIEQL